MNVSKAKTRALSFQKAINYAIAAVIAVWAISMLYIQLLPAPELPPVRDTRGGIPVISLNADTLSAGLKDMCERLARGEKPETDEDKAIAQSGIDLDALCVREGNGPAQPAAAQQRE